MPNNQGAKFSTKENVYKYFNKINNLLGKKTYSIYKYELSDEMIEKYGYRNEQ